jgi:putative intracellular protease/amidase
VHPTAASGCRAHHHRSPTAIQAGVQSFSDIGVPALALCAMPAGSPSTTDPGTALRAAQQSAVEKHVPGARVVRVPGANHYVFITHEADVLREFGAFVNTLK